MAADGLSLVAGGIGCIIPHPPSPIPFSLPVPSSPVVLLSLSSCMYETHPTSGSAVLECIAVPIHLLPDTVLCPNTTYTTPTSPPTRIQYSTVQCSTVIPTVHTQIRYGTIRYGKVPYTHYAPFDRGGYLLSARCTARSGTVLPPPSLSVRPLLAYRTVCPWSANAAPFASSLSLSLSL